jgi:hypothetical protein
MKGQSQYRQKASQHQALTSFQGQRERHIRIHKESEHASRLTSCQAQREGQLRAWNDIEHMMETHFLSSAEAG